MTCSLRTSTDRFKANYSIDNIHTAVVIILNLFVAEIGAVNMGEIGAVRKRSRSETGPRDSSPCVARVKY